MERSPEPSHVDRHLFNTHNVSGYRIQANDGELGHVKDFIVDDESWTLRYLVIATSNWWIGKKVLIAPRWIETIDWIGESLRLNLPREVIKNSPEWKPDEPVNRTYEARLYDYYGRPAYWLEDVQHEPPARPPERGRDSHL